MDNKMSQYVMINKNFWTKKKKQPEDVSDIIKFYEIDISKSKLVDKKKYQKSLEKIFKSKDY